MSFLRNLLASTTILCVTGGVAAAQTATPPADELVVTGTRVVRNGYDAPTPTTVVGQEVLEQRASLTVIDALQTMPAFRAVATPSTGTQAVAGTAGASFLNLRGLGTNRTLTLVDGQRVVPTTSQGQVDVAVLPMYLIKRVDVVTGGASASWGSDAVAGVANFVLDHAFTGFKASVQGGIAGEGDGENYTVSGAYGTAFMGDRAHFMIGAEHYRNLGVGAQAREQNGGDYSLIGNPAYVAGNGQPRLLLVGRNYYASPFRGMVASGVAKGRLFNTDGSISSDMFQFCTAAAVADRTEPCGSERTDRAFLVQWTDLRARQKRDSAYARVSFDLAPSATVFVDGMYGKTETMLHAGGPPISWLLPAGTYRIPLTSAFVPTTLRNQLQTAGETSVVLAKTFEDIPAAILTQGNELQRFTTGIEGKILGDWNYSVTYGYGKTVGNFRDAGLSQLPKMLESWDAVAGPNGTLVCRSTLTTPNNGCVPSNPFSSTPKTAAELAYYMGDATARLQIVESALAINVTGEPISTWAGPVSVAFGADYRQDVADQTSDAISQARGWALANPQPLHGSLHTTEFFGEAVIPLAKDMMLLQNLDVSIAGRATDYSYSGKVNTWKVGGNYNPIEDLRFRVTRSRDIRAPNILELFNPGTQSSSAAVDPRTNANVQFQAYLNNGNPLLKPEIADTTAYGFVYSPGAVPGLRFSIDAYKIEIVDAIAQLSIQEVLNRCQAGNQDLCALVTRNSVGTITNVRGPLFNLRNFETSGVDIEASYDFLLENVGMPGMLQVRGLANNVQIFRSGDGVTPAINQAGSILNSQPKWTGDFTLNYINGPFRVSGNMVYISGGAYDRQYIQGIDISDNSIEGSSRFNIGFNYDFALGGGKASYFFNVDNIGDRGPPTEFPVNGGNYDRVGRKFVTGVRLRY